MGILRIRGTEQQVVFYIRLNRIFLYIRVRKTPIRAREENLESVFPLYPKQLKTEVRMLPEKEVETALIRAIRKQGGLCLKLVCPGWSGAPDRLCLWPGGRIAFAEVKRPGGKPRPLQGKRLRELRKMGFRAEVVDSKSAAAQFGGGEHA